MQMSLPELDSHLEKLADLRADEQVARESGNKPMQDGG
jgi:hypothetical protein